MRKVILTLNLLIWLSICFAQKGTGYKNPTDGQINAKKGKYTETGAIQKFPYTMFVKTKSLNYQVYIDIEEIRDLIFHDSDLFKSYYKTIFKSGIDTFNHDDTFEIGGHIKYKTWEWDDDKKDSVENTKDRRGYRSESSVKCKNAAFVYLMAFNKEGNTSTFRGTDSQTFFKTQAIERLRYMNVDVGSSQNYLQWRTKELILYLQTYDLLKTAEMLEDQGYSYYSFSEYEKSQLDTIKYNLQRFTRNVYKTANSFLNAFDQQNNHSIMSASAVGLAAIVLNDCGHKKSRDNWHPETWIYKAHKVIDKTLWKGSGKLSERGKIAGYAEGPHYFR